MIKHITSLAGLRQRAVALENMLINATEAIKQMYSVRLVGNNVGEATLNMEIHAIRMIARKVTSTGVLAALSQPSILEHVLGEWRRFLAWDVIRIVM